MEALSLLDTLRGLSFLQGVSDEHLQQLASVAELAEFPEGSVIFQEGDPAADIYLIVSGNVSLEICAPAIGCRRVLTVGEGELAGWSPLLEHSRLTATARAIVPTTAIRLPGRQVLAFCEHNARFGYEFMRRAAMALAKRLSAARLQLLDVYGAEKAEPDRDDWSSAYKDWDTRETEGGSSRD